MDDDEADFARFVAKESTDLRRSGWLLTGDWPAADDLVQTTLLKVWQRWAALRHRDEPLPYARRVMFTTYLGWRRRRWLGELPLGWLPDRAAPEDVANAVAERDVVVAALLDLPRQQRAVLVLRYFNDLSEQDTAHALGCSVGSVKTHAYRGLTALRTNSVLLTALSAGK